MDRAHRIPCKINCCKTLAFPSGYGCFGLDPASTSLLGFGPDLLPDEMCGCLAGFSGKGTACAPCDNTSYNEGFNRSSCTRCPASEMRTEAPAKSQAACKCSGGRQHVGDTCGCAISLARGDSDVCVHCKELNLNCSKQGMVARQAPAVHGYARLDAGLEQRDCMSCGYRFVPDVFFRALGNPGARKPLWQATCALQADNFWQLFAN